jgi:hypothetical protein
MTPGNPQRRLHLVEQIHEHLRARLAELEDQVTLGIAPPGADEEIGIIREIFVALGTPCQINKANVLAEEHGTYDAVFKLEDSLAAIAATNLEEMKLKVRCVDLDCITGLDEQIGKLPASIIRDLRALGREPKDQHVRHV